ncbi:MAG: hypothetical protein LBV28_03260 [Puniceicoccales bacterium]|jgi:hypothetical protein|nr:hypothetical protein [Puniceicoccales bacterium]
MKKTLSVLALAVLVAGCTDYSTKGKSPWSPDSGASGPNPLLSSFGSEASPESLDPIKPAPHSWDNAPAPATAPTADVTAADAAALASLPPPTDASQIRITGVRSDLGLFSFVRAEKPEIKKEFLLWDSRFGARVRIVEVDGNEIIAELLPNQKFIPELAVGKELNLRLADE